MKVIHSIADLLWGHPLANMSAYALSRYLRPTPIYEALLLQDGIRLDRGEELAGAEASPERGSGDERLRALHAPR